MAKGLALALVLTGATVTMGCGVHSGTVAAKEPAPLAYQAPDIDEITGIDTSAPDEGDSTPAPTPKK